MFYLILLIFKSCSLNVRGDDYLCQRGVTENWTVIKTHHLKMGGGGGMQKPHHPQMEGL